MIILETIQTAKKFFNFKHPKIYMYFGVFIAFLAIVSIVFNNNSKNFKDFTSAFYQLSFIAFIIFSISSILNKFFKEDINIIKTGTIKIIENDFLIDEIKIPFNTVTYLDFNIADYAGNSKQNTSNFNAMFSAGTQNYVSIISKNEKIKKQVLINAEREIPLLFNFLADQIIKEKFTKVAPKNLISVFTNDFKKTEKARDYIAKQIKNKVLKPTEGLLMMNYTSDKEVKKLREKYNL